MVLVFADKVTSGTVGGESGFRPQSTESFPYRMLMMMMHQPHHDRPFPSPDTENGSEGGGAFFYSRSNEEGRSMSDIYGGIVGGGDGSVAETMQPFNTTSFKSPGGMAASLRFPFTSVQWQELERQALIYKYIMASVPVPPDLLIPISRNVSETAVVQASCSNLRFSSGRDPEPGRCRRTDGKKWRCAKDVAPDQKYCERHMHKCRPRSRKLVELQAEMNTRSASTTPAITSNTSSSQLAATKPYHQHSGFLAKSDNKASPCESVVPSTYYKESRCVDWMMKGETVPLAASNQQWPQLMNSKVGLRTDRGNWNPNASVFQQHYEEPLNLNSYWTYGAGDGSEANQQNDERFLFLNPELASLEKPPSPNQRQMPRRFIDAWSTASRDSTTDTSNKSSILSKGKLSPSSLSLSMSSGSGGNENRDQIQMGLGVIDAERNRDGSVKTQPLSWMSPVSWLSSPPGGPLAEVLGPSPAAIPAGVSNAAFSHGCYGTAGKKSSCSGRGLNLMSDGWGGSGDAGSPSTTTVSSPADVLQKTLASLSDSSGSSSPTFTAGAEKSEIAVQWLNLNKFLSST